MEECKHSCCWSVTEKHPSLVFLLPVCGSWVFFFSEQLVNRSCKMWQTGTRQKSKNTTLSMKYQRAVLFYRKLTWAPVIPTERWAFVNLQSLNLYTTEKTCFCVVWYIFPCFEPQPHIEVNVQLLKSEVSSVSASVLFFISTCLQVMKAELTQRGQCQYWPWRRTTPGCHCPWWRCQGWRQTCRKRRCPGAVKKKT